MSQKGSVITSGQLDSTNKKTQQTPPKATPSDQSQKTSPENKNQPNDFGAVGSLNHQYLQAKTFSRLIVEIDYIDSVPPNQNSTNTFVSTIRQKVDKPEGIVFSGENSIKAQKNNYSVQDLLDIAKTHRSNYSQGNSISLYVLYVNGELAENPNALGIALNSSMFVIFKDKISKATTALVFEPEIEKAVLNHELGHLWGLVNINYQSSIDHEDKEYPHHSNNKESVMYWAVEDLSVASLLRGGPPYQFDSADKEDVDKIKNGLY